MLRWALRRFSLSYVLCQETRFSEALRKALFNAKKRTHLLFLGIIKVQQKASKFISQILWRPTRSDHPNFQWTRTIFFWNVSLFLVRTFHLCLLFSSFDKFSSMWVLGDIAVSVRGDSAQYIWALTHSGHLFASDFFFLILTLTVRFFLVPRFFLCLLWRGTLSCLCQGMCVRDPALVICPGTHLFFTCSSSNSGVWSWP